MMDVNEKLEVNHHGHHLKFLKFVSTHNNKDEKYNRKELFVQWLKTVSELSTIHGMKWHTYFESSRPKMFFIIFIFLIAIPIPTMLFLIELINFFNRSQVQTAIESQRVSTMKYPNLTICLGSYFDPGLVKALGISNDLLDYLVLVFDPNSANLNNFLTKEVPSYRIRITNAEEQLKSIMKEKNLSILDLFLTISVRCEKFIIFCEIRSEYLFSTSGLDGKSCCGKFFSPRPVFTSSGTCFISTTEIYEYWSMKFSFIRVWVKGDQKNDTISVSTSGKDHPVATILQSQKKVSLGKTLQIGLNMRMIDMTQLGRQYCHSEAKSLEIDLGHTIAYTKMNCEEFLKAPKYPNCSLSPYYGIQNVQNNLQACKPKDVLDQSLTHNGSISQKLCLQTCMKTEYLKDITEVPFEKDAVKIFNYVLHKRTSSNLSDMTLIKLYFKSFDMETHVFYQDDILDFFAKVGGWLGLSIGASILSYMEMSYCIITLAIHFILDKWK